MIRLPLGFGKSHHMPSSYLFLQLLSLVNFNIKLIDYNTFVKSMLCGVFACHSEERSDEESRDTVKLRFFATLRMTIMEGCLRVTYKEERLVMTKKEGPTIS